MGVKGTTTGDGRLRKLGDPTGRGDAENEYIDGEWAGLGECGVGESGGAVASHG